MADNQNELQPLSDASRERIKLTASLANGIAVGCFVIGGIAGTIKLMTENSLDDGMSVLMYLSTIIWFIVGAVLHLLGLKKLGELDK